jgi:hypothetical protein
MDDTGNKNDGWRRLIAVVNLASCCFLRQIRPAIKFRSSYRSLTRATPAVVGGCTALLAAAAAAGRRCRRRNVRAKKAENVGGVQPLSKGGNVSVP